MRALVLALCALVPAFARPAPATVTSEVAASYLAGTPWEAGSGDLARLAALEMPKAPNAARAARIALAEAHAAAGDSAEAARRWAALAGEDDLVASPWLRARAVAAYLEAGDTGAASGALDGLPADHPGASAARLRLSRALVDAGKTEAGLKTLGDPQAYPGAERAAALELAARHHEPAAAAAAWRELYLAHPETAAGQEAASRLAAAPTAAEETERVERLLAANRNALVIREAETLLRRPDVEPKSDLGCRVRYALGKANRQARNYLDAIDVLSTVFEDCKGNGLAVKALYLWASAASIALKDPAVPLYEQLVESFPGHPFADDALFFIADLHLRAGRTKKARAVLERQTEAYPKGDYHGEALWRLFWTDWTAGKKKRGLRHLDRILEAYAGAADNFDVERARYWKARVLAEQGEAEGAAGLYETLVESHPLSYHAMLGLSRLEELDPERAARIRGRLPAPPASAPGFSLTVSRSFAEHDAVRRGAHLLRLGLEPEAAGVLDGASDDAKTESEVLLLALLLDRAGDPYRSHWLIRTRAKGFDLAWPEGAGWQVWRAAYPLAFRAEVEKATGEFGVPVNLLQALIREESALQPEVISWAGAVGLAQLMPYTARDLARRMKISGEVDLARLQDPVFNLRLAARYLSDLLRRMDGNVALAVAGYNAGERTVGQWKRARADWDVDAFVEAMTIGQTRRYTRRVLRSYATYSYLYGEGEARFLRVPKLVSRKEAP